MRSIAELTLVDAVVVGGVAVVLPLALGRTRRWVTAAGCVVVALPIPTGPLAALLVLPWVGVGVCVGWEQLRRMAPLGPVTFHEAGSLLAVGYATVAALALVVSRMGCTLFGIGEPIVELTAMHFTFAGTAALTLALHARERTASPRMQRTGTAAVVLTGIAPLFVATGFVTTAAVPQVGGAVLLSIGVWLTCTLELLAATDRRRRGVVRVLLAISGLSTWVPMALAVGWAAGQHWDVPALSIPDMARTHGLTNAVAFVGAGLVARVLEARTAGGTLSVGHDQVVPA